MSSSETASILAWCQDACKASFCASSSWEEFAEYWYLFACIRSLQTNFCQNKAKQAVGMLLEKRTGQPLPYQW